MGGGRYSDSDYVSRSTTRANLGVSDFAHSDDIKTGVKAATVADPLDVSGGQIRESRDSVEHPNALPIFILLDVTGSMQSVPRTVQAKIPKLMGLLLRKGYVEDPQILFGAIGDATDGDKVPLQIGQFESDARMEDGLINLYLEGGGGGGYQESYELGLWYAGNRTALDSFEKRGRKGYLFILGDELPYPSARASQIQKLCGVTVQGDVPLKDIMASVQEKFEVYHLLPSGTSHANDPKIINGWRDLLGQNSLKLEDVSAVVETIASIIGLAEGAVDIDGVAAHLKDVGAGDKAGTVLSAVGKIGTELARVGTGDLPVAAGKSSAVSRL